MPIYEYVCENCGKLNELIQKVNDPAPEKCEGCGTPGKLTKVLSRSSFQLKGGGWYSDLYSSTKKDSGGGTKAAAAPARTKSAPAAAPAAASTPASSTPSTGSK